MRTNRQTVEKLYAALQFFYPWLFNSSAVQRAVKRIFKYKGEEITSAQFKDELLTWAGTEDDIAYAINVLKEAHQKTQNVDSNTQDKFTRERGAEELEAFKKAYAESKEKGIRQTQEFLKQQQERAERLKEILEKTERINAKVEKKAPPEKLSQEQVKAIDNLKEEAVQNPKAVTEQLAQEIKNRIAETTPPEILDIVANETAYDVVQTLREDIESPIIQTAYFQAIAKNPEVIEKVVPTPEAVEETKDLLQLLTDQKTSQLELSKQIFGSAFGKEAAKYVFADKVITISETPAPEYTQTFSLSQIPENHLQNLSDQNALLDNIRDLGFDEARSRINTHLGGLIEKRIAALPEGHFLKSEFISNTLGVFGVGPAVNWVAVEGASPIIKFAVSSGYGPLLGGVQSATGWKLGISKLAAPVVEKAVAAGAGKVAVGAAAKTGLAATLSTAFAALGSWAPIVGNLIGAALGWIAGKILEKIPWDKVKKALPYLVGALLFPFFGPIAAIAGGLGTALIGGATLAGIGAGIGAFFWTLGRATAITIGTPVIVTLLVFPVVVALILFIINSGAYIVPPSPLSALQGYDNPYMSVTKTADPDKIDNPSGKTTVTYTVEITALKSPLSNVHIVSTSCKVTKKDKSQAKCPIENIPDIPSGTTISPASPYTFTFDADFDPTLSDSIVFDTIEISADAPEESGIATSGSETVCVGDCPTSCVKVSDNAIAWPNNLRSNVESYTNDLDSEFPGFAAQVCANGEEVNLCYNPPRITPGYYAWHVHNQYGDSCDVYFNQKGVNNPGDAKFLVTHELTHHVQKIDSGTIRDYENSGAFSEVQRQGGFCSYSDTKGSNTESMAEATGLYASIPSWGTCASPYKSKYPKNFVWAEGFMK